MTRKTKLNLTINDDLKGKMRELAQKQGQSVSEITADLYSRLISGQRFLDFVYVVQAYYLRENDVLLYCSLVDRQIVYYRGNDLRVVFPANRFDVVYTRGCQHDLNAGNFENGIISTVKNASNHIQENSIRIGSRHNYDRIKKLCMYWGIVIGIFLVISLVIWQRRRLDAWFDFEEGEDNEAE